MGTAKTLDPVLADFVQEKLALLRERFTPQHVIIFGSRARNEGRGDSDIDLIVVSSAFGDIKWPLRASEVLLTLRLRRPVDVLCYTPEEFEKKRRELGVVATACEEGIWL